MLYVFFSENLLFGSGPCHSTEPVALGLPRLKTRSKRRAAQPYMSGKNHNLDWPGVGVELKFVKIWQDIARIYTNYIKGCLKEATLYPLGAASRPSLGVAIL